MADTRFLYADEKRALWVSLILHAVCVVLAIVGLPFMKPDPLALSEQLSAPVEIEVLGIDELRALQAAYDKKAAKRDGPPPQEALTPPSSKKPAPAPSVSAEAPPDLSIQEDVPVVVEDDLPPPDKQAEAVPAPPEPEPDDEVEVLEVKKTDPPKKPKPDLTKKAPSKPDAEFSSLLKNLMAPEPDLPEPPRLDPRKPKEPAKAVVSDRDLESVLKALEGMDRQRPLPPNPGAMSLSEGRLNASEVDAVKRQIAGCWSILSGARYAENLAVKVKLFMNPDRTLRKAVIVDQIRYNRDMAFRAAADSALRALRVQKCRVLNLPSHKYEQWKTTVITFDPKDIL